MTTIGSIKKCVAFIDTNLWKQLKFNFNHHTLKSLSKAVSDSKLSLISTSITVWEMEKHLKVEAQGLMSNLNKFAALKHLEIPFLETTQEQMQKHLADAMKNYMDSIGTEVLEVTESALRESYEAYLQRKPPFHTDVKQFPDSYAIETIKEWHRDNKCHLFVCSGDHAFRDAFCEENEIAINSIPEMLDLALKMNESNYSIIKEAAANFAYSKPKEVRDEINDRIQNAGWYSSDYYSDIEDVEVVDFEMGDFKLTQVDSESFEVAAPISVKCSFSVSGRTAITCPIDKDTVTMSKGHASGEMGDIEGDMVLNFYIDEDMNITFSHCDITLPRDIEVDVDELHFIDDYDDED